MRPAPLLIFLPLALACGGPGSAPASEAPTEGAPDGAGGGSGAGPLPAEVGLERLDPSAECDGLVPASAPDAVTVRRSPPAGTACAAGISDGTGAVALAAVGGASGASAQVYGRDGAPRGAFTADLPLVPEPSGWHALVRTPGPPGGDPKVEHVAIAPDGSVAHRETVSPDPALLTRLGWNLSSAPAGGSLFAIRSTSLAGNHWSRVDASRFDASGARRWTAERITTDDSALEPTFLAVGGSTGGDALVLSQDSAQLDVTWLDPDGAVVASADRAERFDAVLGSGALQHDIELAPLLDGSIALRSDGAFRRSYAPRALASGALPDWLAARSGSTFRITRGGRGYAVLPPAGAASPACTQAVELVSRGGRLCGRITFREEGSGCTTGAIDQGWDGTVVQQSGKDACVYRWWPGLLAAP